MKFSIFPIFPGIFFSFIIAYAGIYLSDFIGTEVLNLGKSPISPIMLSIIIGLLVGNIFKIHSIFLEGINFSLKFILRLGIICLGIRLGLLDILKVGIIGCGRRGSGAFINLTVNYFNDSCELILSTLLNAVCLCNGFG